MTRKPFNKTEKALIWSLIFVVWLVIVVIGVSLIGMWMIQSLGMDSFMTGWICVIIGLLAVIVPTAIMSNALDG